MNQQNDKSGNKITKSIPSMQAVKGALTGTTGIALISTAAVGVAGYFLWKNRAQVKRFVGNHVDLPNFIAGEDRSDDSLTNSKSANLGRSSYSSSPSTSHRM